MLAASIPPTWTRTPTFTPTPLPTNTPTPVDRGTLESLYRATGGDGWKNNDNCMSDRSLNEWHGVETDADGRVTSLDLSASQLTGEIPSELGSLVYLRTLDLSADQLIGCVPRWAARHRIQ